MPCKQSSCLHPLLEMISFCLSCCAAGWSAAAPWLSAASCACCRWHSPVSLRPVHFTVNIQTRLTIISNPPCGAAADVVEMSESAYDVSRNDQCRLQVLGMLETAHFGDLQKGTTLLRFSLQRRCSTSVSNANRLSVVSPRSLHACAAPTTLFVSTAGRSALIDKFTVIMQVQRPTSSAAARAAPARARCTAARCPLNCMHAFSVRMAAQMAVQAHVHTGPGTHGTVPCSCCAFVPCLLADVLVFCFLQDAPWPSHKCVSGFTCKRVNSYYWQVSAPALMPCAGWPQTLPRFKLASTAV